MKKILLALAFVLIPSLAWAQNPTCPTRLPGDSSNACASTAFVQQNPGGGVITVESCKAKGDGITDDAPAIRECLQRAGAHPLGGEVQLSCNKIYLLASKSPFGAPQFALLNPYSNVTLSGCGPSSVLKVAAGLNTAGGQFMVIYPPDETITYNYTNLTFRNFKIDFNGANNTGFNYQNVGIGVRFGNNIVVDGVVFLHNPGSQNVSFGTNGGITVTTASIRNSVSIDGCEIVNSSCTDHSAFYGVAQNFELIGNFCSNSSQSFLSTCIEMHGISLVAIGNTDTFFAKSFNIAAQIGHTVSGAVISNHTSLLSLYGVTLWALDGFTFSDVVIVNSAWRRSFQPSGSGVGFMDFSTNLTNANSTNVILSNVIIDQSLVSGGSTAIDPTIKLGQVANVKLANVTVTNGNGPCIGNGTAATSTSWEIFDTICIDTGQSSNAAAQRGILLNSGGITLNRFKMRGVTVENIGGAYSTTGIDITLNATYASLGRNDVFNVATPQVLSGTGFAPTISGGACGAGANGTVAGTNFSGIVTIGAAATTTCTITFASPIIPPSACTIFPGNAAAADQATTLARAGAPSSTAWVITGSVLANTVYNYNCS